jgi:uroporphyrinogen-III decarboxylase
MYETFSDGPDRGIHLCGDATRHFPTIHEELQVNAFDTGFPVDFTWLREVLGPEVIIQGGPHIELLLHGSARDVHERTRRILQCGVMSGGKFILREGNNLAPKTPISNIEAMYASVRMHGNYR